MKTYDGLFIFSTSLKDEALAKVLESIGGEISKQGGKIGDRKHLGVRGFARPMKKQESGNYVRISFEAEPDKIAPLKARFKLMEDIFRVQIVIAGKKVEPKVEDAPESKTEGEPKKTPAAVAEEKDDGKL